MVHGIGFEINEADVVAAYTCTLKAAALLDRESEALSRVRDMLEGDVSNKMMVGNVVLGPRKRQRKPTVVDPATALSVLPSLTARIVGWPAQLARKTLLRRGGDFQGVS
jgi:hypothetical protein